MWWACVWNLLCVEEPSLQDHELSRHKEPKESLERTLSWPLDNDTDVHS